MTTIAYRDGVMASDSRAYAGGNSPIGFKKKIHELADGSTIGISSVKPGLGEALVGWFADGADLTEVPDIVNEPFSALLVKPDGSVFLFLNSLYPTGPLEQDFFAIGSGEHLALGAMAQGATAEQAVGIAIALDVWSGGPLRLVECGSKSK